MVTIITIASIAILIAALVGIIIRQKARAYRDLYISEASPSQLAPSRNPPTRRPPQGASTHVRKVATSRRKVEHACAHHAY
jgi:hypothetical protein